MCNNLEINESNNKKYILECCMYYKKYYILFANNCVCANARITNFN